MCVCDLCVITHIYCKVVWFYEVAVCPVCFRGAVLVSGPCQSLSWPTTEYHRHSGCVLSHRCSLHTLQLSWKHLHHQGTISTIAHVYSCCHLLSPATMCHCMTSMPAECLKWIMHYELNPSTVALVLLISLLSLLLPSQKQQTVQFNSGLWSRTVMRWRAPARADTFLKIF